MFLEKLHLTNVLSFRDTAVELGQLNVVIGANAVGKSNLIEAISLLRATSTGLAHEILRGGGVRQWLWLRDRVPSPLGLLECDVVLSSGRQTGSLRYTLQFSEDADGFVITAETLAKREAKTEPSDTDMYFLRQFNGANLGPQALEAMHTNALTMTLRPTESILSQFKNPLDPTPITNLGNHFGRIRIYREFRTAIGSPIRSGINTSAPRDALTDGGDNLALVLNELDFHETHERIKRYIRRLSDGFDDVKVRVGAGLAQIYLRENGLLEPLSAMRMSDGTLKFLCLLAALFNPTPSPLICIEEPELGMHPDALSLAAEALVEASESVQLIITTHSEALIDALSDHPEAILVTERDFERGTQFRRLSADKLAEWLKQYTLGELWRKGEIGGGRW